MLNSTMLVQFLGSVRSVFEKGQVFFVSVIFLKFKGGKTGKKICYWFSSDFHIVQIQYEASYIYIFNLKESSVECLCCGAQNCTCTVCLVSPKSLCLLAVLRISDLCLSLPVMLLYFSDVIWVIFLYHLSSPRARLTGLGWQGREQRLGRAHQGGKTVHMPSGKYSAFLCGTWAEHTNYLLYSWRPILSSEPFTEILIPL